MAMTETGEEGKGRHEVHELVRKASMEAALDPEHYLGVSGKTVDRIPGIVGGVGNQ